MTMRSKRADAVGDKLMSMFTELEPLEKLQGYCVNLHNAWAAASSDGTVSEQFADLEEWFESYGSAVAMDAISDACSSSPEFQQMYTTLSSQQAFDDNVEEYVMGLAPEVVAAVDEAGE